MMKFSIQFLLIAVLLVAAPLAGVSNRLQQKRDVIRICEDLGRLHMSNQPDPAYDYPFDDVPQSIPDDWMTSVYGEMVHIHPDLIDIRVEEDDLEQVAELLALHGGLRGLRELRISVRSNTDFDFSGLAGLKDVRRLNLRNFNLDTDDIRAISRMDDLEVVILRGGVVKAADLEMLKRLPHLAWVALDDGHNSPEEMADLRRELPRTYLSLAAPR